VTCAGSRPKPNCHYKHLLDARAVPKLCVQHIARSGRTQARIICQHEEGCRTCLTKQPGEILHCLGIAENGSYDCWWPTLRRIFETCSPPKQMRLSETVHQGRDHTCDAHDYAHDNHETRDERRRTPRGALYALQVHDTWEHQHDECRAYSSVNCHYETEVGQNHRHGQRDDHSHRGEN